MKKTWQIINNLLEKLKNINCSALNTDGKLSIDPTIIAGHFNNHFVNAGSNLGKYSNEPNDSFKQYLNAPSPIPCILVPLVFLKLKKH